MSNNEIVSTNTARRVNPVMTVSANTFEEKVNVLNILSASEPVADHLNKVIQLVDVIIQPADMTNEETGENQQVPRVTLIDDKGKSYRATSAPFQDAVLDILFIMGHPNEWSMPLPVKAVKEGAGTRKYFILQVAPLGSK